MNFAEREHAALLDHCAAHGIAFLPFAPLGAHPMKPGAPLAGDENLRAVAQRHDATPAQIALVWMLRRAPNVIAIPGTTSLAHLEENVAAGALKLNDEDLATLGV
jgi:aryl-alcohol dehydrogenase-like predicted oxidoreductase